MIRHAEKYPSQVALAHDFTLGFLRNGISPDQCCKNAPLILLTEALLLFNTVAIRADSLTVQLLYRDFSTEDLEPLLSEGRMFFCPPVGRISCASPVFSLERSDSLDRFASDLSNSLPEGFQVSPASRIVKQVMNYLKLPSQLDHDYWEGISQSLLKSFWTTADRPEYSFLRPTWSPQHYRAGLEMALGRIVDFISVGVKNIDLDTEAKALFEICYPRLRMQDILGKTDVEDSSSPLLNDLHSIGNVPSVAFLITNGTWTKNRVLEVVQGEEASYLRNWISEHLQPGLDVRDIYLSTLKDLPSKDSWTTWIRFGAVSIVSTILGALNPILGAAIGASDVAFGDKMTENALDEYHPRDWVSFIDSQNQS